MKKQSKSKPAQQITPTPEYDSQRETRVLLDEVNHNVKMVAEQHGGIVKRLDNIESELGSVKSELGSVKSELGSVKSELGIVKSELGIVKSDMGTVKSELNSVKMVVMDSGHQIKALKVGQQEIKQKLDTVVSQNEERFKRIEEKIEIA